MQETEYHNFNVSIPKEFLVQRQAFIDKDMPHAPTTVWATENDEVEKAGVKFSTEKNAEVSLATP